MLEALVDHYKLNPMVGIHHLDACDCKKTAQQMLCSGSFDHGGGHLRHIQHVNENIEDRITDSALAILMKLFPDEKPEQRKANPLSAKEMERRLKKAKEVLDNEMFSFPPGHQAYCASCDDRCECWSEGTVEGRSTTDRLARQCSIRLFIAGHNCKDWSNRGLGLGCNGPSFRSFLIMMYEIRHKKPEVVILECSANSPDCVAFTMLGDLYEIDSVILCPKDFGWPVNRKRK